MHTVEFEAEIINGIIKIPQEYKNLYNTHAKVLLIATKESGRGQEMGLSSSTQILDFSKSEVECFKDVNPVEYQRKIRDAK